MKLPQGYKRWPTLRHFDKCDHLKGSLLSGFHSCGAPAVVVVGAYYEHTIVGFLNLCEGCRKRLAPKGTIMTKGEYQKRRRAFARACKNAHVTPQFAERCINEQYKENR